MTDFCLKCFNIINNENKTEDDVVMQWDFCERCNQTLPCVIYVKTKEQKELEERDLDE